MDSEVVRELERLVERAKLISDDLEILRSRPENIRIRSKVNQISYSTGWSESFVDLSYGQHLIGLSDEVRNLIIQRYEGAMRDIRNLIADLAMDPKRGTDVEARMENVVETV